MSGVVVGLDIGGTFTDCVAVYPDGSLHTTKVPSTPSVPSTGLLNGLDDLTATFPSGQPVAGLGHATTVATNAIIESRLAAAGLIVTRGFRDVLEIGRQNRPHLYDLQVRKPEPIIPRDLVWEVTERMESDGSVRVPLDVDELPALARSIRESGVRSVVVCLLHSYRNAQHELRVAEELGMLLPEVRVTASAALSPLIGEYSRACTAALNARLLPAVGTYLEEIGRGFDARGLTDSRWVMRSSGGGASLEAAALEPVTLIESGPAAGITAAQSIGRKLGIANLLTLDMGGTTTKASIVLGGMPRVITDYEVGAIGSGHASARRGSGYPIQCPVIDVFEIGTGGGSIAWKDNGGRFVVGPRSAGAEPGPACYDKGGTQPTVTDADYLLGLIPSLSPLGKSIRLNREPALAAMGALGDELGLQALDTARGVVEIADAAMASAIHSVTVERGHDPREFTMMAFGGAAPLHACAVAEIAGVDRVVIPPASSVFSALGVALADVREDAATTFIADLDDDAIGRLSTIAHELFARVEGKIAGHGLPVTGIRLQLSVGLRIKGQLGVAEVAVGTWRTLSVEELTSGFFGAYEREYGYRPDDVALEIVHLHVAGIGERELTADRVHVVSHPVDAPETTEIHVEGYRTAPVRARVHDRSALDADWSAEGPALIVEPGSTTFVRRGWAARYESGCIMLERVS
jgi:N-methylhydantoinase A